MANEENTNERLRDNDQIPDNYLSPSILNLLPRTISPKNDRQTFRTAFVHAAAILFFLVCGACAVLAYKILQPFLRSILWSILAGAFLFPFKKSLTSKAKYYLKQLDNDSHLLFFGLIILLPLRTIDRIIESVLPFCKEKKKELLIIIISLQLIVWLQRGVVYHWIITISYEIIQTFIYIVHLFDSLWVTTLVIAYLIAILTIYNNSPLTRNILNIFAIPVWFILLIYLSQYLPVTYRLTVVILAIILTVVGFIVDLREHIDETPKQTQVPVPVTSNSTASSTPYFQFVLWSLVAIKVYQFYWSILQFLVFVIIYKIIKYVLILIYFFLTRQPRVQCIIDQIVDFLKVRRDVLTPSPLHGLVHFLIKGDKKFNYGLRSSIDYLVSACMIVTLLITLLFGSIFLIIQIHHESIHMIKLSSNLINETVAHQSSLQHMLPNKEHMSDWMDAAVNNVCAAGRTWIAKQVHTLDQDNASNSKLEEDVLLLWDRLCTYMINTSTFLLPDNKSNTIIYSSTNDTSLIPNLFTQVQASMDFHISDLYNLVHDNLGLLRTVFDSVWSNATLLLTLLSSIISLLFTGGFALLNFLVSFIVFVTLLFYLLSNSDQPIYRPTEWLNNTLAVGGKNLGKAVHEAVTSVFVASLKMAAFYGLYTYVLHTIVGSHFVFLPAVIASICAVTLKSYWAALPGCLDLWIVQQRPLGALFLLIGQMAPVYVVDTAIYSEVKGDAHQYLTALAIAGGVYYGGIEGALIGPIVLCSLLVGVRLYNETMATTLSTNNEQEPPTPL